MIKGEYGAFHLMNGLVDVIAALIHLILDLEHAIAYYNHAMLEQLVSNGRSEACMRPGLGISKVDDLLPSCGQKI